MKRVKSAFPFFIFLVVLSNWDGGGEDFWWQRAASIHFSSAWDTQKNDTELNLAQSGKKNDNSIANV